MKRIVLFIWVLLLVAVPAIAAKDQDNRIKSVKIEQNDSEIRAKFRITNPDKLDASELTVQSEGNLFWIDLPNTIEKKKKRIFYDWKCESLKGVGLKKVDKDTVALRVLFQEKFRPKDLSWVSAKIDGKNLVMTFLKKEPTVIQKDVQAVSDDEITIQDENETSSEESIETPIVKKESPIDLDAIFGKIEEGGDEEKDSTGILGTLGGSQRAETKVPGFSASAVKFVSALLIVIGFMFAAAWLAKKYNLPQKFSGGRQGVVRVLGSTMLGMKKQVAVIDVAGQYMVVGMGQSTITMLGKVDDPEAIKRLAGSNEIAETKSDKAQQETLKEEPFVISDVTALKGETSQTTVEKSEGDQNERFGDVLEYQSRQMKKAVPEPDPIEDPATIRTIKQRLQNLKRL